MLLEGVTDRLALMFDSDDAGLKGRRQVWKDLHGSIFLRNLILPPGQQPDQVPTVQLKKLLAGLEP